MALMHKSYIHLLRQKVREAVDAKRSIIVFAPINHRVATLRAIGLTTYEKLILVPNYKQKTESGATDLHLYLLKIESEEIFWSRLASVMKRTKLYGEYGNGCVSTVKTKLQAHGIIITQESPTVFDYPQELLEK